jgi:hypothetical protein
VTGASRFLIGAYSRSIRSDVDAAQPREVAQVLRRGGTAAERRLSAGEAAIGAPEG